MPNYSHGTKLTLASVEEPPYLTVGTDVSAKYKGAFCEAKIIDVNKHVKLRVLFDGSSGSFLIDDTDLKPGPILATGTKIEARHPEKKQQTYVQATITKILDHSRYTVLFDDGDQSILRRNSLCLKSGKHFAESETLDQLPLTNPEHFGNPVKVGATEQLNTTNHSNVTQNNAPKTQNNPPKSQNNHLLLNDKPTKVVKSSGKRRESVNNGSKAAMDLDDNSVDSSIESGDANSAETDVKYELIDVGVKLMVQYGKGKVQNFYEAKVNKVELNNAGKIRYFVHYTGWNNRYDEWITKNRIHSIVVDKENGSRDKKSKHPAEAIAATNSTTIPVCSSATATVTPKIEPKEKEKEALPRTRRARQSDVSINTPFTSNSNQIAPLSTNSATTSITTTAPVTTQPVTITTATIASVATTSVTTTPVTATPLTTSASVAKTTTVDLIKDVSTPTEVLPSTQAVDTPSTATITPKAEPKGRGKEVHPRTRRARQSDVSTKTPVTSNSTQIVLSTTSTVTINPSIYTATTASVTTSIPATLSVTTTPATMMPMTTTTVTLSTTTTKLTTLPQATKPVLPPVTTTIPATIAPVATTSVATTSVITVPEIAAPLTIVPAPSAQTTFDHPIEDVSMSAVVSPNALVASVEKFDDLHPVDQPPAAIDSRPAYRFCDDIDESDCDKKISILQERIMTLRQTYAALKTELSDLDRRKKRPRTERSNSDHISNCSVVCRS